MICFFFWNKNTDVVVAYKNLKKEKEALESTVRVLSSSATESPATTDTEGNATPRDVLENLGFIVVVISIVFFCF